jgi:hypothetical protein
MGLDTIAVTLDEDGKLKPAPDEPFEGLRLCGGIYSGGSDSASIRGKVYAELVEAATGVSLYEERIEPPRVAAMARRLRRAVDEAKRAGPETREGELPALDEDGKPQVDEDGKPRLKTFEFSVLDVGGIEIDPGEAEDLARWFEVCAEHGYALKGWW